MKDLEPSEKIVAAKAKAALLAKIELKRQIEVIAKAIALLRALKSLLQSKPTLQRTIAKHSGVADKATTKLALAYLLDPEALESLLGELEDTIKTCELDLEEEEQEEAETVLQSAQALLNPATREQSECVDQLVPGFAIVIGF